MNTQNQVGGTVAVRQYGKGFVGTIQSIAKNGEMVVKFGTNGQLQRFNKSGEAVRESKHSGAAVINWMTGTVEEVVEQINIEKARKDAEKAEQQQQREAWLAQRQASAVEIMKAAKVTVVETGLGDLTIVDVVTPKGKLVMLITESSTSQWNGDMYWTVTAKGENSMSGGISSVTTPANSTALDAATDYIATWVA